MLSNETCSRNSPEKRGQSKINQNVNSNRNKNVCVNRNMMKWKKNTAKTEILSFGSPVQNSSIFFSPEEWVAISMPCISVMLCLRNSPDQFPILVFTNKQTKNSMMGYDWLLAVRYLLWPLPYSELHNIFQKWHFKEICSQNVYHNWVWNMSNVKCNLLLMDCNESKMSNPIY